jgi:hypothetical protein
MTQFEEFKQRALENPETRRAYERATRRRVLWRAWFTLTDPLADLWARHTYCRRHGHNNYGPGFSCNVCGTAKNAHVTWDDAAEEIERESRIRGDLDDRTTVCLAAWLRQIDGGTATPHVASGKGSWPTPDPSANAPSPEVTR